jgi:protein FRA10AC1
VHFVNTYILNYVGAGELDAAQQQQQQLAAYKTDRDIVRGEHRFLWEPRDEEGLTWERRLAKRYYDKLFKEYAIADLSRYKDNQIALRWRTQQEVIGGKGQFVCAARKCSERSGLQSWEVNFGYVEHGEKRNALVKVRLCPACSAKLNYRSQRRKAKARAREKESSRSDEAGAEANPKSRRAATATATERDVDRSEGRDGGGDAGGAGAEAAANVWAAGRTEKDDDELQAESFDTYFDDMFL